MDRRGTQDGAVFYIDEIFSSSDNAWEGVVTICREGRISKRKLFNCSVFSGNLSTHFLKMFLKYVIRNKRLVRRFRCEDKGFGNDRSWNDDGRNENVGIRKYPHVYSSSCRHFEKSSKTSSSVLHLRRCALPSIAFLYFCSE